MSLLIKNAHIFDPLSSRHDMMCDILIENCKIKSFEGVKTKNEVDIEGCYVFPGWFDLNSHFNDPGTEFREDFESGILSANYGGFTDVQLVPNTNPPLDTKSGINYLLNKVSKLTDIHVSAAVSKGLKGESLTEIYELYFAGVRSFSEGDLPIWNPKLLMKVLEYTSQFNIPIIQNPIDRIISMNSQIHEGRISTRLGLVGEPSLSEELIIRRDIEILKYSGGSLHISRISSKKAVQILREAKMEGLNVTADVGIHHLLFTDSNVNNFNTVFKSQPHFRSESDREALIEGVNDGTIDAICSNHRPQDEDSKQLEFDLANPGTIALQTFYPTLLSITKKIPLDTLIKAISYGPRKILGLNPITIEENCEAKLTIVNPEANWILNNDTNKSKSKNSPFWEKTLKGKVVGLINRNEFIFFS